MIHKHVLWFVLLAISSWNSAECVTIMSVDFGSEWMKVAVVAPGIPMEIALNQESKRKTPVAVSFRNGERTFGEDALFGSLRSPTSTFFYFLDLLGKKIDNPIVKVFMERFPYYNIESDPERGTLRFRIDDETTYSVEELVAQLLTNAKEIAMAHTNQKTKDIVITVPPFFNQAERRSMLAAADLAGLKVLSLMSTNAAVALNYGMFRRKEINGTAENILFYDMGASSTTATIASYQTIKTKENGYSETNPMVTILGMGYDRTLGGLTIQLKLRDLLATKFNEMKKTTKDVFESPRAMGKLMKESGKLLKVLSANQDHMSQVEGVLDDQDFRFKITREMLEGLSPEFFDKVRSPIDDALVSASIDISEINQFIIVGGATRIPKVQSILQSIWGKELGKNINADEAAALGAVYRAADLGQGFKVLKFHVKEAIVYPVEVEFERHFINDEGEASTKTVKRFLFARGNNYPMKKVMTFNKHTEDFNFYTNYGDLDHLTMDQMRALGSKNISHVNVSGVTSAFQKQKSDGSEAKGIKAHFSMDDSGILTLNDVEAIFEKNVTVTVDAKEEEESTWSKIGSNLSKLFADVEESINGTEARKESDAADSKKNKTEDEKSETKAESEQKTLEDDMKKKNVTSKLVTVKEELQSDVAFLDVEIISVDAVKASKDKLQAIYDVESARKDKEVSKNNLESYNLDVQDKLTQNDYIKASKKDNREKILQLSSKNEEWLYDEGFDESATIYKEKLKALEKLFEPIRDKVREHTERPEAIKALNNMINMTSQFLTTAHKAPEEQKYFTDVELKTLDDLIIATQKWLETKEEEQETVDLSDDPKLTLYSIAEKIQELDREVKYMVSKARIAKAKKDKEIAEAKFKAEKAKEEAKKNKTTTSESDKKETVAEGVKTDGDSRQEPPMPTMEDDEATNDHQEETEENESETDRRKEGSEDNEQLKENLGNVKASKVLHTEEL